MMLTESFAPRVSILSRLPKFLHVELPTINLHLTGEYTLSIYRPDGSLRYTTTFQNQITDSGIARFTSALSGRWIDRAVFLEYYFPVGQTTTVLSTTVASGFEEPYFAEKRIQFQFPAGTINGELHQVAVGWGQFAFFSITDIKDVNGEPIRLKVLSDETVDLRYRLRMYIPIERFPFSVELEGIQHDGEIQVQKVDNSNVEAGINSGWNLAGRNSSLIPGENLLRFSTSVAPRLWDDDQLSGVIGDVRQIGGFTNNDVSSISTISDSPTSILGTAFWDLSKGNTVNGVGRMCFRTGDTGRPYTNWNATFVPRIMKNIDRQLTIISRIEVRAS